MIREDPFSTPERVLPLCSSVRFAFGSTRTQVQASMIEVVVALLLIAAALLLAAWITLTFALLALIQTWFLPSAYSWMWAGLIVAILYLVAGSVVGWFGYTEMREVGVAPKRTLEVLKQDQVWIENEARTA